MSIASRSRARCSSSSGSTKDQAKLVAGSVEQGALGSARFAEPRDADTPVVVTRLDDDHPLGLEHAEEPTHVSGIEVESRTQRFDVETADPDLPQDPRCAEPTTARQVPVAQNPDPLSHRTVEASHMLGRD